MPKIRGGFLKEIAVALQRLSQLRQIAVVRFSKQQSVSQRMTIRIAVCDIAANQVTEIRLYIFKYHGDIFY